MIDFVGANSSKLEMIFLDIYVLNLQLTRGILVPLDSSEIVYRQPYFKYFGSHSFEETNELEIIPTFQIEYFQFLIGIILPRQDMKVNANAENRYLPV